MFHEKSLNKILLKKEHALTHDLNTQGNSCFHGDDCNNTEGVVKTERTFSSGSIFLCFVWFFPFLFSQPFSLCIFLSPPYQCHSLFCFPRAFGSPLFLYKWRAKQASNRSSAGPGPYNCFVSLHLRAVSPALPFHKTTEKPEEVR